MQTMLRQIKQATTAKASANPDPACPPSTADNAASDLNQAAHTTSEVYVTGPHSSKAAASAASPQPDEQGSRSDSALSQGSGRQTDTLSAVDQQPSVSSAQHLLPHKTKQAAGPGRRALHSSPGHDQGRCHATVQSKNSFGLPLHLGTSLLQQSVPGQQGLMPEGSDVEQLQSWATEIIQDHPGRAKAMLGVLATAYGVLVHQVAMHCYERGALMAGLWNMYTTLMDAEVASSERHVQVSAILSQ